jgi:hypothetical protein
MKLIKIEINHTLIILNKMQSGLIRVYYTFVLMYIDRRKLFMKNARSLYRGINCNCLLQVYWYRYKLPTNIIYVQNSYDQ